MYPPFWLDNFASMSRQKNFEMSINVPLLGVRAYAHNVSIYDTIPIRHSNNMTGNRRSRHLDSISPDYIIVI